MTDTGNNIPNTKVDGEPKSSDESCKAAALNVGGCMATSLDAVETCDMSEKPITDECANG